MKYIVMEIQQFDTGAVSSPVYAYDDVYAAESKYHAILSSAATSALPVHSCILMNSEGYYIKSECFKHGEEEVANE